MKGFNLLSEFLVQLVCDLFHRLFSIALFPDKGPRLVELDPVVRIFQPGKHVFGEKRIFEFGLEEGNQIILSFFPLDIPDRNEIKKIDLRGFFLLVVLFVQTLPRITHFPVVSKCRTLRN